MTNTPIAIAIPFFGKVPKYIEIFLSTASLLKKFDFLLFTDTYVPTDSYKNIRHFRLTLNEFNERVYHKIGRNFAITPPNPYKLCDFKPTYGVLFEDLFAPYEFWGFGDIDLIFGNVDKFITEETLQQFDVITIRKEYISGALTIWRNTRELRTLYRESKDFGLVLGSPHKHFSFTECNKAWDLLIAGQSIFDAPSLIETMTHLVKRLSQEGRLRALFKTMVLEGLSKHDIVVWNQGTLRTLSPVPSEYMMYHWVKEKRRPRFRYPNWNTTPSTFYVSRSGFYNSAAFRSYPLLNASRVAKERILKSGILNKFAK